MRFLRKRRDEVESVWVSDKPTAVELGRALAVLGSNVTIVRHPYARHPASGSGNCWCGRAVSSSIHDVVIDDG